ncbi:TRAP transporter substrate-binding protein [Bordetella genomosp. 6]|uniref:TRAP transporter substrate-binding protein n=1 Tax=Bordetella genomosp. 6 TaxID=463024 RepID=UPI000A295B25|nr:TRAP transporter substrate-binding protein DctP [Bordetella genomosp. 6]ARP76282.1 ABC transporter substrate-binding protein [Bordetella genomosp. 6]
MQRRRFLTAAAAGAGSAVLAAPAVAQEAPTIRWRMPSSFPRSLDTVWGAAEAITARVSELTDGKFAIRAFPAGEIVPPLQVLDAVQNGTTECGHTAGFYYMGKEPALVFDTGVPFGLTPRQHSAWVLQGGGQALIDELYAGFNAIAIPCGNTGAQMGGWFRKQMRTPEDFKGLRIRTPGLLSMVYQKLGAIPQQVAGSDIYPALEKGSLDAVEFVGPYDDEKLGFAKVAQYYYGPGVMELGANLCLNVNREAWQTLPARYQAALRAACAMAGEELLAKYDAHNIPALKRLVGQGAKLQSWSPEIMAAMQKATREVLEEYAAKSPRFAKVLESWRAFRADQLLWASVNDGAAERYLLATRENGL